MIAGFFMVLKKQLSQAENPLDTDVPTIDNNTDSQGDAVSLYLNTFKFNKMENNYTWDDGKFNVTAVCRPLSQRTLL